MHGKLHMCAVLLISSICVIGHMDNKPAPSCILISLSTTSTLLQAALWRQEHRSDAFKQRKLIVWEVDETEPWEGERHRRMGDAFWLFLPRLTCLSA